MTEPLWTADDVARYLQRSRATAVTRLAKRLDILDLARMIGHRDIRSLSVYYRATAADIARKL